MDDADEHPVNPMEAIQWLVRQQAKQRFGKDNYGQCLDVIRTLILERAILNRKVEKLERVIAALQKSKEKPPYDIGGQGQWGPPDVPDSP